MMVSHLKDSWTTFVNRTKRTTERCLAILGSFITLIVLAGWTFVIPSLPFDAEPLKEYEYLKLPITALSHGLLVMSVTMFALSHFEESHSDRSHTRQLRTTVLDNAVRSRGRDLFGPTLPCGTAESIGILVVLENMDTDGIRFRLQYTIAFDAPLTKAVCLQLTSGAVLKTPVGPMFFYRAAVAADDLLTFDFTPVANVDSAEDESLQSSATELANTVVAKNTIDITARIQGQWKPVKTVKSGGVPMTGSHMSGKELAMPALTSSIPVGSDACRIQTGELTHPIDSPMMRVDPPTMTAKLMVGWLNCIKELRVEDAICAFGSGAVVRTNVDASHSLFVSSGFVPNGAEGRQWHSTDSRWVITPADVVHIILHKADG